MPKSAGPGGQGFKLAISRRGARARTSNITAPLQVEFDESGAFGEWFKRPWEEQWAKGAKVSVNLHWWSPAVRASSWRFRGRGARARTSEVLAQPQVERHESGAVGEWIKRPWGKQWAKGQRCQ